MAFTLAIPWPDTTDINNKFSTSPKKLLFTNDRFEFAFIQSIFFPFKLIFFSLILLLLSIDHARFRNTIEPFFFHFRIEFKTGAILNISWKLHDTN